jgi:hypothetical protein
MARPRNAQASVAVDLTVTPKLVAYLDDLKGMEGFGISRSEIIRNFVWKEVNNLISAGRLGQK